MRQQSAIDFWKVAPVEWEEKLNAMTPAEREKLTRDAAELATWFARVSAYAAQFDAFSHTNAVKHQNKAARTVRKALGYSYPASADIHF